MRRQCLLRIGFISLLTASLLALIYINIRNNIHSVIPEQVYRSAQLSAPELIKVIESHHIQTIINLRGSNPTFHSYQTEIDVTKKLKVRHYDIRLRSEALPRIDQLHRLIFLLQHAPRPILLHCKSGADRTGLASALALELAGIKSIKKIKHQFSFAYLVTSHNSIGKLVFRHYEKWLQANDLKNNKKHFLEWAYSQKPYNI